MGAYPPGYFSSNSAKNCDRQCKLFRSSDGHDLSSCSAFARCIPIRKVWCDWTWVVVCQLRSMARSVRVDGSSSIRQGRLGNEMAIHQFSDDQSSRSSSWAMVNSGNFFKVVTIGNIERNYGISSSIAIMGLQFAVAALVCTGNALKTLQAEDYCGHYWLYYSYTPCMRPLSEHLFYTLVSFWLFSSLQKCVRSYHWSSKASRGCSLSGYCHQLNILCIRRRARRVFCRRFRSGLSWERRQTNPVSGVRGADDH